MKHRMYGLKNTFMATKMTFLQASLPKTMFRSLRAC